MINHPDVNKPDLDNTSIRAVVTDIEGTTTDISFVHKVLFPYAHDQLPEYVYTHSAQPDVEEQIDAVRIELKEPDASLDKVVETLLYWIETDQKVTPLKALQGMMWADGYQRGAFKWHLYSDVAPRLRQWAEAGKQLYVYSSGSVQAQKLLFGYSIRGRFNAAVQRLLRYAYRSQARSLGVSAYCQQATAPRRRNPVSIRCGREAGCRQAGGHANATTGA